MRLSLSYAVSGLGFATFPKTRQSQSQRFELVPHKTRVSAQQSAGSRENEPCSRGLSTDKTGQLDVGLVVMQSGKRAERNFCMPDADLNCCPTASGTL
jgi:hypothetical protein